MDGSREPKKSLLARLFWILIAAWYFLSLFLSAALLIGSNFIPSTEWAAATHDLRMILGLLFAALLGWAVWARGKRANMSETKRISAVLCSPVFGYFLGGNILFIWPLLLPLVEGHQVALPFTVRQAGSINLKYCRSPVILADIPFVADRVCQVPDSIRSRLSPGSRIVVRGWGTRLGVYAHDLSLAD